MIGWVTANLGDDKTTVVVVGYTAVPYDETLQLIFWSAWARVSKSN